MNLEKGAEGYVRVSGWREAGALPLGHWVLPLCPQSPLDILKVYHCDWGQTELFISTHYRKRLSCHLNKETNHHDIKSSSARISKVTLKRQDLLDTLCPHQGC